MSVALPALVAWSLCALGGGASQLRGDELCTWWAATLSPPAFERLVGHVDAVLAPYYLFMRVWVGVFGDSEAALRAPSAVAMGACAGLISALGARLVDRTVGFRAALVFAVLPIVSRYGQEARPYALAALFATLSSLLVLRLVEKPESIGRAVAYGLAILALGLCHLVALLVVAGHAVCFIQRTRQRPYLAVAWRPFLRFALAAAAGVGGVLVLIVVGAHQLSSQIGRDGTVDELAGLARKLIAGSTGGALLLGAVMVAFALRAVFSGRQPLMLRVWAALPPLVLLSTYSVVHLWALRYLVFTLPALVLLVANAVERRNASPAYRSWATAATLAVVLAFGARMHVQCRSSLARSSGDYRAMASDLRRLAQPGDAVAFGGNAVIPRIPRLALRYELREGPPLRDVFEAESMADRGEFVPEECKRAKACVPPNVRRIWLMTNASPASLWQGMPSERAKFLAREFVVSEVRPHWHANLALLVRKADSKIARAMPREEARRP